MFIFLQFFFFFWHKAVILGSYPCVKFALSENTFSKLSGNFCFKVGDGGRVLALQKNSVNGGESVNALAGTQLRAYFRRWRRYCCDLSLFN